MEVAKLRCSKGLPWRQSLGNQAEEPELKSVRRDLPGRSAFATIKRLQHDNLWSGKICSPFRTVLSRTISVPLFPCMAFLDSPVPWVAGKINEKYVGARNFADGVPILREKH